MRLVYQRDDRGLLQARFVRTSQRSRGSDVTVREIIGSTPPVLTARDRLSEAAGVLHRESRGALPVRDGAEIAILSEHDVSRAVAQGLDPRTSRVASVMTRDVTTVTADTPLIDAARTMVDQRIRHVVVMHRDTPIAVISVLDVLGALIPATAPQVGA